MNPLLFVLASILVISLVIPSYVYAAKSKIAELDLTKLNPDPSLDNTTTRKPIIQNVTVDANVTAICQDDKSLMCRYSANGTITQLSRCYSLGYVDGKAEILHKAAYERCFKVGNDIDYYFGYVHACMYEHGGTYKGCEAIYLTKEPKLELEAEPTPEPKTTPTPKATVQVPKTEPEPEPKQVQQQQPKQEQKQKLECQPNDDFCTEGCEAEDLVCIEGDGKAGKDYYPDEIPLSQSQQSQSKESNNDENGGNEDDYPKCKYNKNGPTNEPCITNDGELAYDEEHLRDCGNGTRCIGEYDETEICGGEPCTPSEKEDSWLDPVYDDEEEDDSEE